MTQLSAAKFPNVSRGEWLAMCQRSYDLQARLKRLRGCDGVDVWGLERELSHLAAHIRAISHLEPTDA